MLAVAVLNIKRECFMNEPHLVLVTLNYEHGRVFCNHQNIWLKDIVHFATSNQYMPSFEVRLTDNDAVIWYGPWMEGKNAQQIAESLLAMRLGQPFEYDVYMPNESVPWPHQIAERYLS